MKKLFLVTVALALLGSFALQVSGSKVNKFAYASTLLQDNKTKVMQDQLPKEVQDALSSQYQGWTVGDIYLVTSKVEYYSIELTKDGNTKTVNLDKDGKAVM